LKVSDSMVALEASSFVSLVGFSHVFRLGFSVFFSR